jgi:hypothetical protein
VHACRNHHGKLALLGSLEVGDLDDPDLPAVVRDRGGVVQEDVEAVDLHEAREALSQGLDASLVLAVVVLKEGGARVWLGEDA